MHTWRRPLTWLSLAACLTACQHEAIVFNRRYLQDPLMDPAKTSNYSNTLLSNTYKSFDFGASAAEGATSGSCPTCGG